MRWHSVSIPPFLPDFYLSLLHRQCHSLFLPLPCCFPVEAVSSHCHLKRLPSLSLSALTHVASIFPSVSQYSLQLSNYPSYPTADVGSVTAGFAWSRRRDDLRASDWFWDHCSSFAKHTPWSDLCTFLPLDPLVSPNLQTELKSTHLAEALLMYSKSMGAGKRSEMNQTLPKVVQIEAQRH